MMCIVGEVYQHTSINEPSANDPFSASLFQVNFLMVYSMNPAVVNLPIKQQNPAAANVDEAEKEARMVSIVRAFEYRCKKNRTP